jgi:DNA-binding NtrC family response regulator
MNSEASKILFVDDEPQILETLSLVFRGWHFKTANSANAALALVQSEKFAVIVSDQRMPEMTGVELLKQIKEINPSTIRILLTGYSDIDSVLDSVNSGEVYRFINKPWDNAKLIETVQTACKLAELNAELKDDVRNQGSVVIKPADIRLLFVDKLDAHLKGYQSLFNATYEVLTATSVEEAYKILQKNPVSVLACDSSLNTTEGTEFLAAVHENFPDTITVFMSDTKDANAAIRMINFGQIFRYLVKPFPKEQFRITIEDAIKKYKEYVANPHLNMNRKEQDMVEAKPAPTAMPLNDFLADIRSKMTNKRSY